MTKTTKTTKNQTTNQLELTLPEPESNEKDFDSLIEFVGSRVDGTNYLRAVNPHSIASISTNRHMTVIDLENESYSIWTKENYYQVKARIKAAKQGVVLKAFGLRDLAKNLESSVERGEDLTEPEAWGFVTQHKSNKIQNIVYLVNKNTTCMTHRGAKRFSSKEKALAYRTRYIKEKFADYYLIKLS